MVYGFELKVLNESKYSMPVFSNVLLPYHLPPPLSPPQAGGAWPEIGRSSPSTVLQGATNGLLYSCPSSVCPSPFPPATTNNSSGSAQIPLHSGECSTLPPFPLDEDGPEEDGMSPEGHEEGEEAEGLSVETLWLRSSTPATPTNKLKKLRLKGKDYKKGGDGLRGKNVMESSRVKSSDLRRMMK